MTKVIYDPLKLERNLLNWKDIKPIYESNEYGCTSFKNLGTEVWHKNHSDSHAPKFDKRGLRKYLMNLMSSFHSDNMKKAVCQQLNMEACVFWGHSHDEWGTSKD